MKSIAYCKIPEFEKDFKKLLKRFKTLESDFDLMKRAAIEVYHLMGIDNKAIEPIPGFCSDDYSSNKVRKFACKSLKGGQNSGLRVIYVFEPEAVKVTFVEMYFKGDKENEDRNRLKSFVDNLESE